jgi:predicted PilT family ATPase
VRKLGSQLDIGQAMQRVRVGMTGLAAVIILLAVVSALFSAANREEPVSAAGASNASVVANMTGADNEAADKTADEPLAELGVAPSTDATVDELERERAHQQDAAGR